MISYLDITPSIMNTDENDDIKLTCSSYYTTNQDSIPFPPYLVFNPDTAKSWNFQGVEQPTGCHWIKIQFKKKPIALSKINLKNGNFYACSIKNFKIFGSNDDVTYKELYTGIHDVAELNDTMTEHEFNNSKKYTYYRINVLDSNYSGNNKTYGGIGYLQLFTVANKFLISKDNKFYSIKDELYNIETKSYNPLDITTVTVQNIIDNGFNINIINDSVTIGEETFKPLDKFDDFKVISDVNFNINLHGLKGKKELIVANNSFSVSVAKNIDFFELLNNISEGNSIKIVVSKDNGSTWSTFKDGSWSIVNSLEIPLKFYNQLSEEELVKWNTAINTIFTEGIDSSLIKTIDFNLLKADTLRFAYILNKETLDSVCEMSKLKWQFDSIGKFRALSSTDCFIDISEHNISITPSTDVELLKVNVGTGGSINVSEINNSYDQLTEEELNVLISNLIK